jgi:hypothetical protein
MTLLAGAIYHLGAVCQVGAQEVEIGVIDFYGLNRVSADQLRRALTFEEGETVSSEVVMAAENRLAKVPGIRRGRISLVCCVRGRRTMYIGIEEQGTPAMTFGTAPAGAARLPPEILRAGEEFARALMSAVQRGDAGEDRSQGHALAHDPATRAVQERFIVYVSRDLVELRSVLRESSNASQRALAAQILAYAPDKQAVVEDLVQAIRDPVEEVRNEAMRALSVFAEGASAASGSRLRIPGQPFIEFLKSSVWSDRNKASLALMALSGDRDPTLLKVLQEEAFIPLVEMARWKNLGHAFPAFVILARIAGYSDTVARDLLDKGDRDIVIEAAIKRQ